MSDNGPRVYLLEEIALRFAETMAARSEIPGLMKIGDDYRVSAAVFDDWLETEAMARHVRDS